MSDFLFSVFSVLLVIFSFLVIFSNHMIFSLFFLVASFLATSFLLFLLECEFLALIFLTVYVGAIAVLFLFSVMMLDFKKSNLQKNTLKFLPIGLSFGIIILIPLIINIYSFFPSILLDNFYMKSNCNWLDFSESITEIEALGKILYTYFVLHFLLVGIILLVVLFGVVHLTKSFQLINNNNKQILFKQLAKTVKLNY